MVIQESTEDNSLTSAEKDHSSLSAKTGNSGSNKHMAVRKGVLSYMAKKPSSKMLIEAIKMLSEGEKGASVPAITKWIIGNYAVSDVDRLKLQIKKAVLKALHAGTIERSVMAKGSLGTSGSFVLGKETSMSQSKKGRPKSVVIAKTSTKDDS